MATILLFITMVVGGYAVMGTLASLSVFIQWAVDRRRARVRLNMTSFITVCVAWLWVVAWAVTK